MPRFPLVRSTGARGWHLPSGGFINVDLEICAPFDLRRLHSAIEPRLVVLMSSLGPRRSFIRAESMLAQPKGAGHAILDIARVISRLRGRPRTLWLTSPHRVLDIGYASGTVNTPFVELIGPDALAAAVRMGVQLAVTICRTPTKRRPARLTRPFAPTGRGSA
jgi:hypothetical protein